MDQTQFTTTNRQILSIPRSDRWQIHHRLQELEIPCDCLDDGRIQAEANTPVAIAQLWSVVFHMTASRQALVEWLERCCW